jgi:hypothetical protein
VRSFQNRPTRFGYALAVPSGRDVSDVAAVRYDEAGKVVARYGGG